MRALLTGDIHLTSRPKDEYRWQIFPWLKQRVEKKGIENIILLGDICDQKDHHPARLVNRLFDEIAALREVAAVYAIEGNHDYIDKALPFFKFLGLMTEPKAQKLGDKQVLFLPNTNRWKADWKGIDFNAYDLILCHQTFSGAKSSNGFELEHGVPPAVFGEDRTNAVVVSGDVHVPQKIGRITYCGSPHPVHFGDSFEPRVLFYDDGELRSLKRSTIKKAVITIREFEELKQHDLTADDQVKVIVMLKRAQFCDWQEIRQDVIEWADRHGIILHGVELKERTGQRRERLEMKAPDRASSEDIFAAFCEAKAIDPSLIEVGLSLLKECEHEA